MTTYFLMKPSKTAKGVQSEHPAFFCKTLLQMRIKKNLFILKQ